MSQRNERLHHALIVVHGALRNADGYFQSATAGAFLAGALEDTLVVAPRFAPKARDHFGLKADPEQLVWAGTGWHAGGFSDTDRELSSFDVIDDLLKMLADRRNFPNLADVVVTGHSAGGVFVHLYSITNTVDDGLPFKVEYVPANPSGYAYLDATRPTDKDFALSARAPGYVPDDLGTSDEADDASDYFDADNCTTFNDWPFGMDHRWGYAARVSEQQVSAHMKARPVELLLGQLDILPIPHFPMTCPATAQGPTRLARGQAYIHSIAIKGFTHAYHIVPMCGHNDRCMFTSPASLRYLFHR